MHTSDGLRNANTLLHAEQRSTDLHGNIGGNNQAREGVPPQQRLRWAGWSRCYADAACMTACPLQLRRPGAPLPAQPCRTRGQGNKSCCELHCGSC